MGVWKVEEMGAEMTLRRRKAYPPLLPMINSLDDFLFGPLNKEIVFLCTKMAIALRTV